MIYEAFPPGLNEPLKPELFVCRDALDGRGKAGEEGLCLLRGPKTALHTGLSGVTAYPTYVNKKLVLPVGYTILQCLNLCCLLQ